MSRLFPAPPKRRAVENPMFRASRWSPRRPGHGGGVNAEFGSRVVAALGPTPGDPGLDVGCGNRALSLAIAPLVASAGFGPGPGNPPPPPPPVLPTAGR